MIPDATKDKRFKTNSLVTSDPHIRFYAGAPLRTSGGLKLGTLCVVDRLPRRPLHASEKQILTDLAAAVVDEMELRLSLRQAKRRGRTSPSAAEAFGSTAETEGNQVPAAARNGKEQ